ncbi:unnamed protein product [Mytilus edulis]|uniref:CARD domain-containing protein n=1 Tax=Mytilus edulis TaxID=6550 RepID=A0A8S3S5F8_MYTED|nr:unnamed protein product [Mytilus edulis]
MYLGEKLETKNIRKQETIGSRPTQCVIKDQKRHGLFPYYDELINQTVLDKIVLDNLISRCILLIEDREEIIKPTTQRERNRVLLNVLTDRPYDTFHVFKDVLKESDPHNSDIQELISRMQCTVNSDENMSFHEINVNDNAMRIQKNYTLLVNNIVSTTDVTDYLIGENIMQHEEREEICATGLTTNESNRRLLDKLLYKDGNGYHQLLSALRHAEYLHIANEVSNTAASKNQCNSNLASGIREEHDYCVTVSDNLNFIKPVSSIAGGRSDKEVELIYDRTDILPDNLVPLNFCRFIIEIDLIIQGLESCSNCLKPLHLKDSLGVLPRGLGGWLYIECKQCIRVKKIPLSKRHFTTPSKRGPGVFDVNTKIATVSTGMLHVGLGETQLNNLLASVNLHYLSVSGLKTREEEVGAALESYAEKSMTKYLNMESNLQENTHGLLTCDVAKRKGIVPKEHKCSKNHTGSSKGMEPALVVDMIRDVIDKGVNIKEIAGDDDTTGFQRAQNVLKIKLKKRSDKNHIKKNISKQLYAIKKELQRVVTKGHQLHHAEFFIHGCTK